MQEKVNCINHNTHKVHEHISKEKLKDLTIAVLKKSLSLMKPKNFFVCNVA